MTEDDVWRIGGFVGMVARTEPASPFCVIICGRAPNVSNVESSTLSVDAYGSARGSVIRIATRSSRLLRTLASLIGSAAEANSTLSSTPSVARPCCVNSQLEIVFVNWRRWNMSFLFLYRYVSS